ncbi:hypothetical protein BD560DRAFT_431868 [Blakeslea trispora]|nr:hypothetical protein BD560DRAFT_431868 [Blakeslea trispora]
MPNSKRAYKLPRFRYPKFKMQTHEEMVEEYYRRGREMEENERKQQEQEDLLRQKREKKESQRREKEEQDLLKQEQDLLKQEQDLLKEEQDLLKEEQDLLKQKKDLLKQKQDLFKQKQEHVQLMRKKQGIRYIKSLFPKFRYPKFKMQTYEEMVEEYYRRGREMAIKRLIQQEQQDLLKQGKETPCPNSKYSGKVTKKTTALKKKK